MANNNNNTALDNAAAGRGRRVPQDRFGVHYSNEGYALVMGFSQHEEAEAYAFAAFVGGEVIDWA